MEKTSLHSAVKELFQDIKYYSKKYLKPIFVLLTCYIFWIAYDVGIKSWSMVILLIIANILNMALFYIQYQNFIKKLFKHRIILSISYILLNSWVLVIASQHTIAHTGYPIDSFFTSIFFIFISTVFILILPFSLYVFVILLYVYAAELIIFLMRFNDNHSKHQIIKISSFLLQIIIATGLAKIVYNNINFFSKNGAYLFNNVLVYSSFTDISPKCLNKHEIENKYKIDNLQAAVVNDDLVIAIPYNGSYYFEGEKCLRKTDEK